MVYNFFMSLKSLFNAMRRNGKITSSRISSWSPKHQASFMRRDRQIQTKYFRALAGRKGVIR